MSSSSDAFELKPSTNSLVVNPKDDSRASFSSGFGVKEGFGVAVDAVGVAVVDGVIFAVELIVGVLDGNDELIFPVVDDGAEEHPATAADIEIDSKIETIFFI
ncbi:MAG TPA: hypothetical protein DD391_06705 [Clostridiales bacterium]|nr:hypothetical protein [Clostridiales bacterium]